MIDVFRVGVHIGVTNSGYGALSALIQQLTHAHISATKLEAAMGRLRGVLIAGAAAFAGWEILKGLKDATEHAEKLNHELTKLQVGARLTDGQTKGAETLAFQVSRDVKGTSAAENVKTQRELFGVFGNFDTAQALTPLVAQGSRAVSNYVDKETDLAQIAIKALELRGHITKDHKVDPEEFRAEFNALVRSIAASEGLVDPQKLYQFISMAGPAVRMMSPDEMWGMAPAVMNALGASKAGTALMSTFSQFIGHVVGGERVARAMEEGGMLTPGKWGMKKGKVVMDRDAVPDQEGLTKHPLTWLHEHLEALHGKKDKNGKPIDDVGIVQEMFQIGSRQTTMRLLNDLNANWPVIENEEKRWQRMPNPDVIAKEQNDKDLSVNIKNFHEAWGNFMAALGKEGIPLAIKILQDLTDAINYFQKKAIEHPEAARDIVEFAAAFGTLLLLGGSIRLASEALRIFVPVFNLLLGTSARASAATPALAALTVGLGTLGSTLLMFAAGGAAALGMAAVMQWLHDLAGFGNKSGFAPMTGGPSAGAPAPEPGIRPGERPRPSGVAPMPGDSDYHGPAQRSSFVPPSGGAPRIQTIVYTQLNGRTIAKSVAEELAKHADMPPAGTSAFDPRMAPYAPGQQFRT